MNIENLPPNVQAQFYALDEKQQKAIRLVFQLDKQARTLVLMTIEAFLDNNPDLLRTIRQAAPALTQLTDSFLKRLEVKS